MGAGRSGRGRFSLTHNVSVDKKTDDFAFGDLSEETDNNEDYNKRVENFYTWMIIDGIRCLTTPNKMVNLLCTGRSKDTKEESVSRIKEQGYNYITSKFSEFEDHAAIANIDPNRVRKKLQKQGFI
jgi:hypothetical protein